MAPHGPASAGVGREDVASELAVASEPAVAIEPAASEPEPDAAAAASAAPESVGSTLHPHAKASVAKETGMPRAKIRKAYHRPWAKRLGRWKKSGLSPIPTLAPALTLALAPALTLAPAPAPALTLAPALATEGQWLSSPQRMSRTQGRGRQRPQPAPRRVGADARECGRGDG
jgi:hypothetical protein